MRITWIGHACFLLEAPSAVPSKGSGLAVRVLTDPYESGAYDGGVRYRPVSDGADLVTISHSHPDHSHARGVPGKPRVVFSPGRHSAPGVEILGVPAFHDEARGAKRGQVVLFRILLGGVAVVHLGDLGHLLDAPTAKALCPVDVLLLPVGGTFTVGPREAAKVADSLSPRLVIPMHYKTSGVDFPIEGVDPFLAGRQGVARSASSSVEVTPGGGPAGTLVLTPKNLP